MSESDKTDNRGARGVVGTGTIGQKLKSRWHKEGKGLSLKQFARKLVESGDETAKEWFDHKKGLFNKGRSDSKKIRISAEKLASKNARRK